MSRCGCWTNHDTGHLEACQKHEAEVMDEVMRVDIERVRHLAHCYASSKVREICQEEGIGARAVAEGFRLAGIDKRLHEEMCGIYGRPEYGSWPESAADYKAKRFAEMNTPERPGSLCSDCPPHDYPTNKTRCSQCPRRSEASR